MAKKKVNSKEDTLNTSYSDAGKGEITITKLVMYILVFFIPLLVAQYLASFLARRIHGGLNISEGVAVNILMIGFTMLFFFFVIPFVRRRETVKSVRYALLSFLIIGVGFTLPSIIANRDIGLFLIMTPYIASYILLTFIFSPEVLGMDVDLSNWFKHFRQLIVLFVYTSIVTLYVFGFGWIYFQMATDVAYPNAFSYSLDGELGYGTFLYYSVITFTTIGYGDITPVSPGARLVAGFQAMLGMIINVVFIAILFMYISNFQLILKKESKIEKEEARIIRSEKKEEREISQLKQALKGRKKKK